jgi:hypothetical protein
VWRHDPATHPGGPLDLLLSRLPEVKPSSVHS